MSRRLAPSGGACARAALVLAVASCGFFGSLSPITGEIGVSSAEAKHFYTRKRVNGRWISGSFPKRYTRLRRSYAKLSPEPAAIVAPQPPPRELASELRASSPLDRVETTAALGPALDALSSPMAADGRLARLRDALQARAIDLVVAAGSIKPLDIAPAIAAVAPAAPVPAQPAAEAEPARVVAGPLEPRSVSFDFQTGVKTTVFENSVVREPFDVTAIKPIAAPTKR